MKWTSLLAQGWTKIPGAQQEENGKITLEPYAEIPLSGKWIFDDKELLEKIIQQVQAEQVK